MRHGILAMFFAAALLGTARADLSAASDLWTTNVAQALEKAAKEKKDVLMDFTGSDWCSWCIKLDNEVFSQDAFIKEAPKHFVLVKLDFPRKTKLPEALAKQNQELLEKFGVEGFPTLVLADAKGRPYAKASYQEGGAEPYLKLLAGLRQGRAKLQAAIDKAKSAKGLEKAKLLDAALGMLDPAFVTGGYPELVDEIIKADADNKAGLKNKYVLARTQDEIEAAARKGDLDTALERIEAAFKTLAPKDRQAQDLLFTKSLVLYRKKDTSGALAAMEAALAAAPKSENAPRIAGTITQLKNIIAQEAAKKGAEKKK